MSDEQVVEWTCKRKGCFSWINTYSPELPNLWVQVGKKTYCSKTCAENA